MALPAFFAVSDEEQSGLLRGQTAHAASSRFYRSRPQTLCLSAEELCARGKEMLCVSAGDIRRIVSLQSSGTSGQMKRLYFTRGDLQRTVEFFTEGMQLICRAGERVGILFPCETPDGLGDLLSRGLKAFGAVPIPLDQGEHSLDALCEKLTETKADVLVGMPGTLRSAALLLPELRPRAVLLSGDYVSRSLRKLLADIWGCEVFEHYGLTEACYGCAVESAGHNGMLVRRDELIMEIVDKNGHTVPDGTEGEILLTTLRREAMPLLRYRTGDRGIMEKGRLLRALGRMDDPEMAEFTELLDGNSNIMDYSLTRNDDTGKSILRLAVRDGSPVLNTGADIEIINETWDGVWRRGKRRTIHLRQGGTE